jgi:hypothetical protein
MTSRSTLRVIGLVPMLLGACSTAPAQMPVHGVTPGHRCDNAGTGRFLGQAATSETGAAIMRASHAATLRWALPGMMLTMDYREDRVTVHLGPDRRVTQIKCG